ncbi:hypothetical protein [Kineosporia babensis]|uniref:Fibronectin type-III domain-containing protein n=1 Tax=Kineosporia babensis TaxID=499548 RepID=A0A9X1SXA9_9ACTN|nr:hypothetical protein [Kineosporia babensis]MCD5315671.1 hypothetical protein [Kineosporia babensis]
MARGKNYGRGTHRSGSQANQPSPATRGAKAPTPSVAGGSGTRPTRARKKDRTTLLAASAGFLAVFGGLFTTGALDPLIHDTVALVQAKADSGQPEQLNAGKVVDWMYYEDVPEWSQVRGVPKAPRVSKPTEPARPRIAPPEHPHRVLFNGPPPMPVVSLQPPDDCMQPHNPVSIAHNFAVTATGGGNVSVRWWDMGDPDTQTYEVVAVPEYVNQFNYSRNVPQPPKKFTSVKPVGGCAQMNTTVSGLPRGARYTFALMGVNKSPLNSNRTYSITRATSEVIRIR